MAARISENPRSVVGQSVAPLTQLVFAVDDITGCFHEIGFELGNKPHEMPRLSYLCLI